MKDEYTNDKSTYKSVIILVKVSLKPKHIKTSPRGMCNSVKQTINVGRYLAGMLMVTPAIFGGVLSLLTGPQLACCFLLIGIQVLG